MGELLSSFHKLSPDNLPKKDPKKVYEELKREIYRLELEEFYTLLAVCEKIPFDGFPKSIIHGDLFLDNLIEQDGKIHLIDLEEVCINNSIYDIARGVIGCCIKNEEINSELLKGFVAGYEKNRELEKKERELLHLYIIYAGVYSAFWRYKEFNINREETGKQDLYKEILLPIMKFSQNI